MVMLLFGFGSQNASKVSVRVGECARHGAAGDAEDIADLGLLQIGDVSQYDDFTLSGRQLGEEVPYFPRRRRHFISVLMSDPDISTNLGPSAGLTRKVLL
jgi:hypothetical protein